MNDNVISPTTQVRLHPLEYLKTDDGVILRRGVVAVKVSGAAAAEVVRVIHTIAGADVVCVSTILEAFAAHDQPSVKYLLEELLKRRFLVTADSPTLAIESEEDGETAESLFYWHFDTSERRAHQEFASLAIDLVGVNAISRRIAEGLADVGVRLRRVVDYPLLRQSKYLSSCNEPNPALWPESLPKPEHMDSNPSNLMLPTNGSRLLIVTSVGPAWDCLREINRACVQQNVWFLPVVLTGLVGGVGPLVLPGITACLECCRARQNSNLDDPAGTREAEFSRQVAARGEPFLQPMAGILGDVAVMELLKVVLRVPRWRVGTLVEVNLLTSKMVPRPVLKVPRCIVCSPLNRRSLVAIRKIPVFVD